MVSKGFAGAVALIMALAPVAAFAPAKFGVQKVRFDNLNLIVGFEYICSVDGLFKDLIQVCVM